MNGASAVLPASELGGILNATIANSLKRQREKNVRMRMALFDVAKYGRKRMTKEMPYLERLAKVKEVASVLPAGVFTVPETFTDPEEQRKLWDQIVAGQHPLTTEGIVAHPLAGGRPAKAKVYPEYDVFVREVFPGEGGLAGKGAGGFSYSTTPDGPIVGRVGTGFDMSTREDMLSAPEEWVGRKARIRAQEQFPSGAYRAPVFIALHEDYPMNKAAFQLDPDVLKRMATSPVGMGLLGAGAGGLLGYALLGRKGLWGAVPGFGIGYGAGYLKPRLPGLLARSGQGAADKIDQGRTASQAQVSRFSPEDYAYREAYESEKNVRGPGYVPAVETSISLGPLVAKYGGRALWRRAVPGSLAGRAGMQTWLTGATVANPALAATLATEAARRIIRYRTGVTAGLEAAEGAYAGSQARRREYQLQAHQRLRGLTREQALTDYPHLAPRSPDYYTLAALQSQLGYTRPEALRALTQIRGEAEKWTRRAAGRGPVSWLGTAATLLRSRLTPADRLLAARENYIRERLNR